MIFAVMEPIIVLTWISFFSISVGAMDFGSVSGVGILY